MLSDSKKRADEDEVDHPSESHHEMYDTDSGEVPSCIERLFGEPFHVKDEYIENRINLRFVLTVMTVYAVQGGSNFLVVAIQFYSVAIWNLGPSEFQHLVSIMFVPWTIKILYGLIIDAFPICGYKRKIYIIFFGCLGAVTMAIAILYGHTSYNIHLVCLTLNQLSVAFCDVIADALTVERTEFKSHTVATRLQALAWSTRTVSSIVGLLTATAIIKAGEPDDVLNAYWMYVALMTLIPVFGFFLPETRRPRHIHAAAATVTVTPSQGHSRQQYSVRQILALTLQTLSRRYIFYSVLFILILGCTPRASEALQFYLIYELDFSAAQIGYLHTVGSVAFLISIAIITLQSRRSNNSFSLKTNFIVWTCVAGILPFWTLILVFGLNEKLSIPNFVFAISDTVIITVAQGMLTMLLLVLMARICPPGIEGFFMTILTSVSNAGITISLQISSRITDSLGIDCVEDAVNENAINCDFTKLWVLIVITNLTTFLPLVFINSIPNEQQLQKLAKQIESVSLDKKEQEVDRKDMIKLYWLYMDYVYPRCACNCKCQRSQQKEYTEVSMDPNVGDVPESTTSLSVQELTTLPTDTDADVSMKQLNNSM